MHPDKIPKLIYELIKNSRRSDRDLAKVLGFSQPTVTRTRRKLEDERYILQYTAVPDFTKLGFELAAFTFIQHASGEQTRTTQPSGVLAKDPRAIFIAEGSGLGKDGIVVTIHKNYTDYSDFISTLQESRAVTTVNSFIVALTDVNKHLNLASLQKV